MHEVDGLACIAAVKNSRVNNFCVKNTSEPNEFRHIPYFQAIMQLLFELKNQSFFFIHLEFIFNIDIGSVNERFISWKIFDGRAGRKKRKKDDKGKKLYGEFLH